MPAPAFLPIHELNQEQWAGYFRLFHQLKKRFFPREFSPDPQSFRKRRWQNFRVNPTEEFLIEESGEAIGWLHLHLSNKQAYFDWNTREGTLTPPYQDQLCQYLLAFCEKHGEATILSETGNACTLTLGQRLGAAFHNERMFYQLHCQQVNLSQLAQEIHTQAARHPTIRFVLYKDRPDHLLPAYIELYNLVAASIPNADPNALPQRSWPMKALQRLNQSNRKSGHQVLTGILWEDNRMLALSDLNLNLAAPQRMYQGMTGVDPDYRQQGLARWLKQAVLLEVLQRFPSLEIIDTDSHAENWPMRRLNESLGFVLLGRGYEIRFGRDSFRRA